MLFALFLGGILLYAIGSVMDRHERAERERQWQKRRRLR
jgi:hypothetical protein